MTFTYKSPNTKPIPDADILSSVTLPDWTPEGKEEARKILAYVNDSSQLFQTVARWLIFDSQRNFERPTQLLNQLNLFDPFTLICISPVADPMVAVTICQSDIHALKELENRYSDGWARYKKYIDQLQPENDLYNQRIIGVLAYTAIALLIFNHVFGAWPWHFPGDLPEPSDNVSDPISGNQLRYLPTLQGYMPNKFYILSETDPSTNLGTYIIDYETLVLRPVEGAADFNSIPLRLSRPDEHHSTFGGRPFNETLVLGFPQKVRFQSEKRYGSIAEKQELAAISYDFYLNAEITSKRSHSDSDFDKQLAEIVGGFLAGNWLAGGSKSDF